ncbi:ferrous iron transporter B [Parasphingopyxis marina]|uniref:Fe(2+) transporter FeoB n=1 Tax=Parasphingopyxis marina TaxID=2761622 RepID=A0A842HWA1_9SPHN|nr:ferrous iron transporter B [Parasphingopyxis marina]MBC2776220.1 ferrous iron transporter B [Parasphingopyxis marina]
MTTIPLVALVGNPNAGKSALFNALTGARQKVGNYPGVTVERHAGRLALEDGRPVELIDLPGAYSLDPSSPDEAVTRDVVIGKQEGERLPDALIVVVDAANLENHLRFALQLAELGLPMVVALNMIDLATRDGLEIDPEILSRELGVPVIPTVAVRKRGMAELKAAVGEAVAQGNLRKIEPGRGDGDEYDTILDTRRARDLARRAILSEAPGRQWTRRIDRILLHPVIGLVVLLALLFLIFQAVFAWATPMMDGIEAAQGWIAGGVDAGLPDGFAKSLLIDGVINGVGSVIVFLPQILILFFFILLLEGTGYMTRAAFLMDRMMSRFGLSGSSFIPLLSSFACAIPGIMATRTIADPKDRLTTILIAPLMTCSARLPVYTIIIGAFIANDTVGPGIGRQGLVLFGLYVAGVIGAMLAALVLRRTVAKGAAASFIMEMPKYQLPSLRDLLIGLWQRGYIFLRRAGTIIFATTIVLWVLLSFPQVPEGSTMTQSEYSAAGRVAKGLNVVMAPIGFNEEISLALIPAMAAREVAVSALATTYSIDESDEAQAEQSLSQRLQARWSLPTALAFLAWFVFAPQCLSTIAVTRRETNSWRWPGFMLLYLFALAYAAAGITYWTATAAGL